MDYAACHGQLKIVKWLHENRNEGCTTNAMDLHPVHIILGHFKKFLLYSI